MTCRLCQAEVALINSHIIPEFFYRPGYDDKGRMIAIRGENIKPTFIQKGIRERLLCARCEKYLNDNYEFYFSKFWYSQQFLPKEALGDLYCIDGVDYSRFKLFMLSILWRAGVAKHEDFSKVNLGPHEDKIRNMLLKREPLTGDKYQIFGVLLLLPGTNKICGGLIMPPIRSRFEGRHVFIFVFGGCVWHFIVSSHPIGPPMSDVALSENGSIRLPTFDLKFFTPIHGSMTTKMNIIRQANWKKPWRG